MEFWDIYDADKKPTGRTMKRNAGGKFPVALPRQVRDPGRQCSVK